MTGLPRPYKVCALLQERANFCLFQEARSDMILTLSNCMSYECLSIMLVRENNAIATTFLLKTYKNQYFFI